MFCTCWGVLLASALFAQGQWPLSGSVQQQLAQRAPKVLAKLAPVQPFSAPKSVANRGGAPVLDSTVVFGNYPFGDSVAQTKSVFTYPSNKITVQTDYENLGGWQLQRRATQTVDNLNRPLEIYAETYDPNGKQWIPESRLKFYPHGNSLTLSDSLIAEAYDASSDAWSVILQNTTAFDNQDRPVLIFNFVNQGPGFEFSLMDELYYDASGDNYLTDQSIFEQNVWTLFTHVESEFDQHREVLRTSYYPVDDTTYFPTSKIETTYDPAGNDILIKSFDADFSTGGWTGTDETRRSFDAANRLVSEEYEAFGDDAPLPTRTDFVYFNGTDLAVEMDSEKEPGAQNWTVLDKTFYYYSNTTAAGDIATGEALALAPNPTTGLVRLPLDEDTRVLVLNAQGVAVSPAQARVRNGQIDLSNLPAGVYFIAAQQGQQRRTGTVVKQ